MRQSGLNVSVAALLLLQLVLLLTVGALAQQHDFPPEQVIVNLDLPPKQRWTQVATKYSAQIQATVNFLKQLIPMHDLVLPVANVIGADIDNYLPMPYSDEIRGVAEAARITLGEAVLCNIIYDITSFCTSIVAQMGNGTIIHARNLDYGPLQGVLRNMTIEVFFQTNGSTLFYGTTFAGYTGILTGVRPNVFGVTINERDMGNILENALQALLKKEAVPLSFMLRDALANDTVTFESAVRFYSRTQLIAPVYVIVSGTQPGEGVVITRDRQYILDIWRLDPAAQSWYVVETNSDNWNPGQDIRLETAHKSLDALGPNGINPYSIYQVLSTAPVLNNGTVYTTVMSASHPEWFSTMVRLDIPPYP
ncbi:naaa protein [Capsaspora owczarzaki ATCC 30864]|uniref:N-acylethanolamine-hydrolyzing acid amidase n=1 Tax=Capsaspora owczarzaki (strain ATCC 30864) TaxID=595528 RepID=A0A0D2X0R6_CAPO3|nr:naaa protein [Capsaspora owczarzaki ATCC 30864]KJE89524.1 naaa protein [Capsaspora owczarzaki ATCC 30864]|eukprot:XP_004365846.1 naaa protein [Capsaspora owczarzaki ATCC 30864]